ELSANQLEDGADVEEVIAMLRKAAEAVRMVVDAEDEESPETEEAATDLVQDLTPMDLSSDEAEEQTFSNNRDVDIAEEPVLNAS
ncbi:MAG: hypothetical protein K5905_08730, partial [Roseibium sp.]|uniref:hypothetical protein n=1 Tax=Roseibium sp. TaxID=1936156 RepID=UPI0026396A46